VAREVGLAASRRVIRASGRAIRALHRLEPDVAAAARAEAEAALREAQAALAPFPALAATGFLNDAEKEYAESILTASLIDGDAHPDHDAIGVSVPAWLNGLAEAASELRRHALDRLRGGDVEQAEVLLARMDETYDALMTIDHPDAITGGLRRTVDALRAVAERTRGDVTIAVIEARMSRPG
jgi:translin